MKSYFVACVMGSLMLCESVYANDMNNEIAASIQSDKEEYSYDEKMELTFCIENQGASDYQNVHYKIVLPKGMQAEDEKVLSDTKEYLSAGESYTCKISAYAPREDVKTREQGNYAMFVLLLALVVCGIVVFYKKKKQGGALLLAMCLLLGEICSGSVFAEDGNKTIEVTKDILVEGNVYSIRMEVAAERLEEGFASIQDWNELKVKSIGKNQAKAVLYGENIKIEQDAEKMSSVLSIGKDSFLELPQELFEKVSDKVTFSMDVLVAEESAKTANLFQFNPSGYGVGDDYWKDAPEISVKANLNTTFYIGGRTINGIFDGNATYNNGTPSDDLAYAEPNGYKTRYAATSEHNLSVGEWHNVVLQFSKNGYALYVDGTRVEMKDTVAGSDIASSLSYLFDKDILKTYLFHSIGNSVYDTKEMFIGKADNIAVYYDTVEPAKAQANVDKNAEFFWDFSYASIETEKEEYVSDLNTYMGEIPLTNVDVEMQSPDETGSVYLKTDSQGQYYLAATQKDTVLMEASRIGLELEEADLSRGLKLDTSKIEKEEIKEEFSVLTGSKSESVNHCTEICLPFQATQGSFTLVVRVYADGFAYRYKDVTIEGKENVVVTNECSEVVLSKKAKTWAFTLNGTYEGEYVKRTNRQLEALQALLSTPLLAQVDNTYVLITEASVFNNDGEYCSSGLETGSGSRLLNWSFGLARDSKKESVGDLDSPGHIRIEKVETVNHFSTPWRCMIASDDINVFCNSDMIAALNEAPDETIYADTTYIKPGRVAWSWWAEDSAQGSYEKHKEYVDFAAQNGWEYVCLDVGWREIEDRLDELCQYAASKEVGIFVWINYRDMKDLNEMDRLFAKWSQAGAVGLKTDYFESDEASVLWNMQNVATTAAKYKMMVLYHGCVRPAGEYRTYPNVLTMEAVQGEEWHKWFDYPTTENCLMYPFTRNILGSMDYTPLGTKAASNGETCGFGIAKTVVYQSSLQHFANAASLYKKYNGLSLLNHIPVVWEESKILEGIPGEDIALVRKNADEYYYGAMTVKAQHKKLVLDFLGDGEYQAYLYQDNENGSALTVKKQAVNKGDVLEFDLLDNGGVAVMITKENIDLDCYEKSEVSAEDYTVYEAENPVNMLNGTAQVGAAAFCSDGQKVGWIGLGADNTLTFEKVTVAQAGEYEITLAYCCAEDRKVDVTVNGKEKYEVTGLNSNSWTENAKAVFTVSLQKGENTIMFGNAEYYAPDIDYIALKK